MMNIALLAGGDSSEREISLQSAAQVASVLDASKYNVAIVDVRGRDWTCNGRQVDKNDFSLDSIPFDYALILIHGTPGEDGRLQGYLDMMGVPYSSSSMTSSVITFDKITTKRTVTDAGVRVARGVFVQRGEEIPDVSHLGLPLFVKPNASGSSFGVTKVAALDELSEAVRVAFAESDAILIEECIEGREFGCGILNDTVFPITEIIPKRAFFDYEAKYTEGASDEITPADIPDTLAQELARLTRMAYRACRCSGVARVDFIVTPDGTPYMIEINSIPGMSGGSIVPKQVMAMGMTLGELWDRVISQR